MTDTSRDAGRLRYLLASTGVSVTGDGMLLAAAPLLAASLSRDPVQVAAVSAAGYAAWLVAGLPAGVLVDRWPRRTVMVVADLARALVLAAVVVLLLTGQMTIAWLIGAAFLIGVGACFFDPAAQATIPALVSRDKAALDRANGKLWAFDTFGRSLAGPPLGAALYSVARALPFLVDAVSFLASAALVSRLPRHTPPAREHPSIRASIREGLHFVWTVRELRTLTLGMGAYNLCWNIALATLVLFAQDELRLSDAAYGLLLAAGAGGGVLAGWLSPRLIRNRRASHVYAAGLLTQAVAWAGVYVSTNTWVLAGALVVVGMASTTVSVAGGTARQRLSPDHLLGRVVSATRLIGIGSAAAGSLISGGLAQTFGLHASFLGAGALAAATVSVFARLAGGK